MNNSLKNILSINNKRLPNINLSLILYIFRKLDEAGGNNQTSSNNNKSQQLKELYIYIAALVGIIIIILVGYALYRKCVERKVLQSLEQEYQELIYNILNSMSSQISSSLQNSQPRSYNGNPNYTNNFDMGSENINSENDYHEERLENLRKKYGNRILIKCLLKKQIENIEYNKNLEENYGDKCTICMDGFKIGENIYKTPCEHIFHIKCFDKYLKGINKRDKLICPNCNQNLLMNKKFIKLRAQKGEFKNQKIINKVDNGKEIIINNSIKINELNQIEKDREKDKEKEKAEIVFIKRIARNTNREITINKAENIYNPIKLRKSEVLEKDDIKNKNKKNLLFISNNELKKSSDSKGILLYSRNISQQANKINSERLDILQKDKSEEENKEIKI
jgi:hypothetical protein